MEYEYESVRINLDKYKFVHYLESNEESGYDEGFWYDGEYHDLDMMVEEEEKTEEELEKEKQDEKRFIMIDNYFNEMDNMYFNDELVEVKIGTLIKYKYYFKIDEVLSEEEILEIKDKVKVYSIFYVSKNWREELNLCRERLKRKLKIKNLLDNDLTTI